MSAIIGKCDECGGNIWSAGICRLCDLFAHGASYDRVEPDRHNNVKESIALGVPPGQVAHATEYARKMGVPTQYTPEGRAVITSRQHQKKLEKLKGYFNKHDFC